MRLRLYSTLHCHHHNDFCIQMGSDESHFNVSFIEGQSHKTVSINHGLSRERAQMESNQCPAYQPSALQLGPYQLIEIPSDENPQLFIY